MTTDPWHLGSWRARPIRQQPQYDDPDALEGALRQVKALPPLVHAGEVDRLWEELAEASLGRRFLLQGGDCAERFVDCTAATIENKLKILLQMSVVLTWGARTPVVRVARLAGQYAKPRSNDTEVIDGREVLSYRGDHVNGIHPDERRADPARMVRACYHSAATLNYVRALLAGGFADLHRPSSWDLGFVRHPRRRAEYERMIERISESIQFMEAAGAPYSESLRSCELFTSHEGLLLAYEEAQTVRVGNDWYNLGAHFLWIGHRTRHLDGAHVEYFRGVKNPLGVKVGPGLEAAELVQMLDRLNPDNIPGRITLIVRLGERGVSANLPPLIQAIRRSGRSVLWSCDPMHGNTESTSAGLKTRDFDRILSELRQSFDLHRLYGSALGGVHFELTGDDVTECVGGPQDLQVSDLSRSYETFCDPRLNYAQSLELAFLVAQHIGQARDGQL